MEQYQKQRRDAKPAKVILQTVRMMDFAKLFFLLALASWYPPDVFFVIWFYFKSWLIQETCEPLSCHK